jgi:hypothetical protein
MSFDESKNAISSFTFDHFGTPVCYGHEFIIIPEYPPALVSLADHVVNFLLMLALP